MKPFVSVILLQMIAKNDIATESAKVVREVSYFCKLFLNC